MRNHRNRPEGNPSEGVGSPNTFITPARHRILSFALAVCLLLTMVLVVPGPVEVSAALPNKDDEGNPWDGIDFNALVTTNSGIYYGVYDHYNGSTKPDGETPILWRVWGEEANNSRLTLMSEYLLDAKPFYPYTGSYQSTWGDINQWENAYLNKWLNNEAFTSVTNDSSYDQAAGTGFLDSFEQAELNLIEAPSSITTKYQNGNDTNHSITPQRIWLPATNNWSNNEAGEVSWHADLSNAAVDIGYGSAANQASYKGGSTAYWWLRSPFSDNPFGVLCVYAGGHVTHSVDDDDPLGVRPAFQLNPESVIFTSEIGLEESKGGTQSNTNYSSTAAAGGGAKNYKLVIVNNSLSAGTVEADSQTVDSSTHPTINAEPGASVPVTASGATGNTQLTYKIVSRTSGEIVGYGQDSGNTSLTVDVKDLDGVDLADGTYTVYVWAQQNNSDHSHEGSQPMYFTLDVADALSGDATLEYVAGKPVTATGGTGATTQDPLVAEISLGHSTTSISDADLVAAGGATAELYDDDTYANPQSPITLDPDVPTHLYIKVTAQDGTTMRYYRITATIQPAGASTPPSVSTNNLTVTVGETADFTVNPGEGADAADHASISSSDTTIATATPTSLSLSLGQSGTVTVEGKSVGNATISIGYGGGSRDGGSDTVQVTVTDPANHSGSGSTRSSGGSSGGSSTPDSQVAKTQLPASAFSWDGRTLTIDHERITPLGLLSVRWDGQPLTRGTDYEAYQGSVIVRFGEDFMAGQSPVDHTVRVEFLNHTGETAVTVGGAGAIPDADDNDTYNPNTGGYPDGGMGATDNPNTGDGRRIWQALLLGSLSAAALVIFRRADRTANR